MASKLKINIRGIGYVAHILQSYLQTSADSLPTDVKATGNKVIQCVFSYRPTHRYIYGINS